MQTDHPGHLMLDGNSLTIESLCRIARDPLVKVRIDPAAIERVTACRRRIEQIVTDYRRDLSDNRHPLPHVYGVTTGFGEFKDEPIPLEQLVELQENILLSHSVGVGDTPDELDPCNYWPADVVRVALVLRLNTLIKGFSGVRVELVEYIATMINRGIVPLVPTRGSVGSSGDLCPLAHLFVVLLGESRFYVVKDREDLARPLKGLQSGRELAEATKAEPVRPSYKEGLALTNGATFSAAILALAVQDAENLANTADIAAALAVEAVCGRTRAFDDAVHAHRNLRGQRDSAANLRSLLQGSRLTDRARSVQDVYSLRCAPQVHGASRDAIAYAKMTAMAEINAATDNPLFFPDLGRRPGDIEARIQRGDPPESFGDEHAFSAGNFHGQPVAIAADLLAIAVAELANIAERRTQMLLDRNHNRSLPGNLIPRRGVNSGLMLIQYCAASLVSENKVLSHPASVDSIPTSANTEDHNAMASVAARKLRSVVGNAQAVLAINLIVAAQAVDWRAGMNIEPNGSAHASPRSLDAADEQFRAFEQATARANRPAIAAQLGIGSRAAYELIRSHIEPVIRDRVLEPDIRAIRMRVASGELVRHVQEAVAAPMRSIPPLMASAEPSGG
jgi:histidine ammonia-lyase